MSIRSLVPKFLVVLFVAACFAFASQTAEAARYGNTSNRYTGAFRGMNNSATFKANGYRTGMQNPGSFAGSSSRRGFFGRRFR